MSLKTTLILILAAGVVGIVFYINPFKSQEEKEDDSPWFYQVSMEDIESIEITHYDDNIKFVKGENAVWVFEDIEKLPPSHMRWGGITLLLSGPQTRRDLTETKITITDPAQYGLDNPASTIEIGLTLGRSIQFSMGDTTTDGRNHYSQISGFPQLFLIANTWGEVIARLAKEPPYPRWYIKRDPDSIIELNLYLSDPTKEDTPRVNFQNTTGEWTVKDFSDDIGRKPVDAERWEPVIPLLGGPPGVSVAVHYVDDLDYTDWGLTDDSRAIEIRFKGESQRGTSFTDGILLSVGDKTPDGRAYYGKSEENLTRMPVILLDAEWTETLFELFDDIPYGDESDSKASAAAE